VPFGARDDLADAVIGGRDVPSPVACLAVGVALLGGAALVSDRPHLADLPRRVGLLGMAAVLSVRGGLGIAGRTDLLSPGSTSARFRRLDRRVYAPLCLGLAAGALRASVRDGGDRELK
jgi:hypothetical protein